MGTIKKIVKGFLPRSLMGRSLVILIAPIFLVQLIGVYIFFDIHWNKITSRMAYAVAGEISIMGKSLEQNNNPADLSQFMGLAAQNLGLQISFDKGGDIKKIPDSGVMPFWEINALSILKSELNDRLKRPFFMHYDEPHNQILIDIKLKNGALHVVLPERRFYSSSGYVFLLWMMLLSFILVSVSILFMRNQIRPIRKLAAAAERFGKGRDVQFFKAEGAIEVRQAGRAFIDMHGRIKRQIEQRTTMLAGVSHDLRTPLTRLKLQLAMMGDSPDVDAMNVDVAEMEKMIAGYLDFVRGEAEEQAEALSVNALIDKITISAKRQGMDIQGVVGGEVYAMLKPMAFERCLMNLVNNAGKYARHVWVAAYLRGHNLEVTVDDDGPGIPEDKYEEVFRPFYRVDTSRNASTGGVGLGLPIAMDIAHAHGGEIWLEKSQRGGLRVVITIPV